jgi:hypothetical protein
MFDQLFYALYIHLVSNTFIFIFLQQILFIFA